MICPKGRDIVLDQNERAFSRWFNANELANIALPTRDTDTTVLYADMNGNGSTDVVWIQPDGSVEFLELFPVRPNLMINIENNLGMRTRVEYDASLAREHQNWSQTSESAHAHLFSFNAQLHRPRSRL